MQILALMAKVVRHDVPMVDGLLLNNGVQVEKVKSTKHTGAITAPCYYAAKDSVNIPIV